MISSNIIIPETCVTTNNDFSTRLPEQHCVHYWFFTASEVTFHCTLHSSDFTLPFSIVVTFEHIYIYYMALILATYYYGYNFLVQTFIEALKCLGLLCILCYLTLPIPKIAIKHSFFIFRRSQVQILGWRPVPLTENLSNSLLFRQVNSGIVLSYDPIASYDTFIIPFFISFCFHVILSKLLAAVLNKLCNKITYCTFCMVWL
jgi:hypothetical protein